MDRLDHRRYQVTLPVIPCDHLDQLGPQHLPFGKLLVHSRHMGTLQVRHKLLYRLFYSR